MNSGVKSTIVDFIFQYGIPGSGDFGVELRVIASDLALLVEGGGTVQRISVSEAVPPHSGWHKLVGKRWVDIVTSDSQARAAQLLWETRAGAATEPQELNQQAG